LSVSTENETITLRRTQPDDLYEEAPFNAEFAFTKFLPSAILEVQYASREPMRYQEKVDEVLALLRLYRVASIHCVVFVRWVDSIIRGAAGHKIAGTVTHVAHPLPPAILKREDELTLSRFVNVVLPALPRILSNTSGVNTPLHFSYQRYADALITDGVMERRIGTVVMGLESLYMADKDLSGYKISHRAAKTLASFSHDPLAVQRLVKIGYDIRSTFAHGDTLSSEKRREYERKTGKTLAEILHDLLEYLRISIIVQMLNACSKMEFIRMIDDSWISPASGEQLRARLDPLKAILRKDAEDAIRFVLPRGLSADGAQRAIQEMIAKPKEVGDLPADEDGGSKPPG
jgi:hypothetical protein